MLGLVGEVEVGRVCVLVASGTAGSSTLYSLCVCFVCHNSPLTGVMFFVEFT